MKNRVVGKGAPCPKCAHDMLRWGHPEAWAPKPAQPFYFEHWDRCSRCRHMQHYPEARVFLDEFGNRIHPDDLPSPGDPPPEDRMIGVNYVETEDDGFPPF